MSVRVISQVIEASAHAGSELLMLVVLADYSDDAGNSYPAVASLARKCRMSPRNANYILTALQASGELRVLKNEGPKGTNRYRIMLDQLGKQPLKPAAPLKPIAPLKGASPPKPEGGCTPETAFTLKPTSATPEAGFLKPLKPTSDEPSLNRQEPQRVRAKRSPASDRGSRLPADWTLPAEWRAWAEDARPDINVEATADSFADHWHAQPGAKGRKADWLATWRNWVRNQRALSNSGLVNRSQPNPMHADNQFHLT